MANKRAALKAAIPHTIPVFTGFIVLGAAYGILMDSKGFSLLWTLFTSTFI
jgi:predicted branched-subunit amino acid permease